MTSSNTKLAPAQGGKNIVDVILPPNLIKDEVR